MNMVNFTKDISQLIETQFPDIYREEGEVLIAFTKAYYEFLESDNRYASKISRQMFDIRDIDTSMDDFLKSFKETYLADFPFKFKTDTKFAIKNIVNYYRTKGSKESLSLLMKLLFEEEVSVYYPGEDVLKPSDSDWYKPSYLEVTVSSRNASFLNKEITGVKSGAKAFVESIVRKRITTNPDPNADSREGKGKIFDVFYLSGLRGNFITGERVTDNGVIAAAPRIKGSMTSLEVILGGRNNSVGDVFDVVTSEGKQGRVKVTNTVDATGRVDFEIVDGGWGFSADGLTDIYLSDAILFVNNPTQSYLQFEKVYQPIEVINIQSAGDILSANSLIGKYIIGRTSAGALVANGIIVATSNTITDGSNTVITSAASSNGIIRILTNSGTFASQRALTLSSNNIGYSVGETITGESKNIIGFTNLTGVFTNGETVKQSVYETYGVVVSGLTSTLTLGSTTVTVASTSNLLSGQPLTKTAGTGAFKSGTRISSILSPTQIKLNKTPLTAGSITFTANQFDVLTNYAFGNYVAAQSNAAAIVLEPSWGTFSTTANTVLIGATSSAEALPTSVSIPNDFIGARGKVTSVNNSSNTIIVDLVFGDFVNTKKIKGDKSNLIYTVNTNAAGGAFEVFLEANNNANGIISLANTAYVEGIVIGQNTTSIGVFGNTSPFFYSNTYTSFVYTKREDLLSPPRDSNNTIIEIQAQINRIPGGKSATFEIGALSDVEENVTIYSDIIGGNNIAGVPYTQIQINGQNSGTGLVSGVDITDGGTGYTTNDRIQFLGGGFANGTPTNPAGAFVTCNANGAITSITVDIPGSGYYQEPTLSLPGNGAGIDATVAVEMDFGYGFPKNPNAESGNLIGDVLDTVIMDVGGIALLSRINPGTEYTASPFVNVRNKYVSAYGRRDLILRVTGVTNGSFAIGEEITQIIGNSVSVKGTIRALNISSVTGAGEIYLKRKSIAIAFTDGVQLTGSVTGARATLAEAIADEATLPIGHNATITAEAISATGVATGLEVVDSGFGYVNNGEVVLEREGNQFIITATTKTQRQGTTQGYWRTTTSHLNSEKKIHDNKYYQEYSYDVLSGLSLNRYESILKKVFHVAGTRMFGSVVKNSAISKPIAIIESNITKTMPVETQLVTQSGLVLLTRSGDNLIVRKETTV
jgi:hypothetical protein